MKTENFQPGVKWIFWPFSKIFFLFSFCKNTDILISYNWKKISEKWYYKLKAGEKENSCAYRFFISRCCKYGLLALLQLPKTLRRNWEIKGKTEIYSLYFLFPSLTPSIFVQKLEILNVNLTSQISYLQNVHCNKFKHAWLDKALIA